jgi:hypothetical protein
MRKVAVFLTLAGLLFLAIVCNPFGIAWRFGGAESHGIRYALAQTGGPYDLSWSTIDGGGHTFSTGGDYSLGGTIGQPDPGLLAGGDYTLGGGFWGGGAQRVSQSIYLPVVLRSYGP